MELLSMYIFNALSIQTAGLPMAILTNLKDLEWFSDDLGRPTGRFRIMKKRFNINGTLFRVMIRFQVAVGDLLNLDMPVPFQVAQLEQDRSVSTSHEISLRFKDVKAWHGREVKTTIGFVQAGVPMELIDAVQQDLKYAMDLNFNPNGFVDFGQVQMQSQRRTGRLGEIADIEMLGGLTADVLVDTGDIRVLGVDLDRNRRGSNS